jgi:hypothetical protein
MKKKSPLVELELSEDLEVKKPQLIDRYEGLSFGGDNYSSFVSHVDGVFKAAAKECYGHFVSLTEPIVSQEMIIKLVNIFKAWFQQQYWAIATLLKYSDHMKLAHFKHLLPFYDQTIFYCFLSLCHV